MRMPGLPPHGAAVGRQLAAQDLEQRGLAGAVAADDADALARLDLQAGIVEQRKMAVRDGDVVEGDERHSVFSENGSELAPEAGENSAEHLRDRARGRAMDLACAIGHDIAGLEVLAVSRAELGGQQMADAAELDSV